MRSILFAAGASILSATIGLAATPVAAAPGELKSEDDRVNYAIGYQIGSRLKQDKIAFRSQPFSAGAEAAIAGTGALLSKEEREKLLAETQARVKEAAQKEALARAQKGAAEGKAFLDANAKKEGVKTLPSGLQIKVVKEGEGASPSATDTVLVNYRGTLIDGTEFDSSYRRNQAASFQLGKVIKGWTEGMQLMKPGGKYMLFIPAPLAYGERGWGKDIPPNSALIFEVELLGVKAPT
jgi:FKBP-type peptidyl-prolyl cis-trans isomerase FklB